MSNQLTKVDGEKFLYFREVDGIRHYYLRKRTETEDTEVALGTTKITMACKLRDSWVHSQTNQKLGITKPAAASKRFQVVKALDEYQTARHPTIRRGKMKNPGKRHLRQETDAIVLLRDYFKPKFCDELDQDLLDQYREWRKGQAVKEGADCARTVDLELNTLSNSLHWAVRKKKIKENPIAKRTRYYSPTGARHAKSVAPKSTDEFHEVGALLFSDPRSESLGWQWCWEGMSGMRTEESIMLQFKPNSDTPGNVDGDHMWVRPSDKNDRGQPYLYLHDGLKAFLDAHARWHELRYPRSPWMFPGRTKAAGQPLGLWSLTTALDRLFENGKARKLTSHGARAFYVLVRRSWAVSDSQIAVEINQVGGLETLRIAYGVVPQSWLDGKGPKLPWIPVGGACWAPMMAALEAKLLEEGVKVGEGNS